MYATQASMDSERLCGAIFVAIPTAIPADPLTRRLGKRAGRTVGSTVESSKLFWKSTVSLSISRIISLARRFRRDSV